MRSIPRTLIAAGAAVATLVALVACSPSPSGDAVESEITLDGGILEGYDPFNGAHLFFSTGQAVYDPLIMVTMEGVPAEPWLAESFEISPDGYKISFKLREDVDFSDGTHLDAPGLEKYLNALFASDGYVWKIRVVDQVGASAVATGEYTLDIVTTKQPITDGWLWQFGLTPIASPATVGVEGAFDDGPVGSGPYVITDSGVASVSISYERNPDYWNTEKYPYDKLTIMTYADDVAKLNALKSGQLDVGQVGITYAPEAESSGLTVTEGPGNVGTIYIKDHHGVINPAFGDVRVRQAINMVFDRDAILQQTNLGFGRASSQPFGPGQAGYVEGGDDTYPFDVERARELMAEAGYANGFDVTIPTFSGAGFFNTSNIEPIVQTSLAEIGINVTYVSEGSEQDDYMATVFNSDTYPLILLNMPQTNWVVAFDEWWIGYDDPTFEAAVQKGRLGGPAEQAESAIEVGQFLLEQAWYVPFSFPATTFVSIPEVAVQIDGAYANPKLWQYTPAD